MTVQSFADLASRSAAAVSQTGAESVGEQCRAVTPPAGHILNLFLLLQSRLVVKTTLKLLIVFVEYTESNSPLLIKAVNAVDSHRGK